MPRIRPAMRSGWNGSSASIRSPTPINTIGLPVIARIDRQRGNPDLTSENGELLLRGWPLHVQRGEQYLPTVLPLQAIGDFRGGCRLARALQSHQHHDDRRRGVQINPIDPSGAFVT